MTAKTIFFDRDEVLRCSRGELFSPTSPRLPAPPFLAFETVSLRIDSRGNTEQYVVSAVQAVSANDWYFSGHFADDPIMPGALMLDGLFQLGGFLMAYLGFEGKGRARSAGQLTFRSGVTPTDRCIEFHLFTTIVSRSRGIIVANGSVSTGSRNCCSAKDFSVVVLRDRSPAEPCDMAASEHAKSLIGSKPCP